MPKQEMEYKSLHISEVKSEQREEHLFISGYGAYFGNEDSYGDIIQKGAFADFLALEDAKRLKLCWQHDMREVIGVITNIYEDEKGLFFEAKISNTQRGKDVATLLEDGAIDEFSIGYYPKDYEWSTDEKRILKQIYLYEISVVSRAANPLAKLVDKEKKEENIINQLKNSMRMEEMMKKMQEDLAKETSARVELEKKLQEMEEAKEVSEKMQSSIDNLDKSIKDLEGKIEDMKKKEQEVKDFATALNAALTEKKDAINAMFAKGEGSVSVKFATSDIAAQAFGAQQIQNVFASPIQPNAFYTNLPKIARSGNKVAWLEGSDTDKTGYIAELASGTESTYAVTEKQRNYAKIGTFLKISSEVQNWFALISDWAKNRASLRIVAKIDNLIFNGAGADGSKPSEVYGLKTNSTAFAALGQYEKANIADVILDSVMQIAKAGYVADQAYVSYKGLTELRGLKDANGNYIYNQATGMLGQVKVIPTTSVADAEVLTLDSNCVTVFEGNQYELEISRIAAEDAWGVYLRKSVQVVVSEADKKGIVYTADTATAISAITKA
jgi:HK97 family phage prohead protease